MKYRKRPIVIEAVQVPATIADDGWPAMPRWLWDAWRRADVAIHNYGVNIRTLEGIMHASAGDYIIRGVAGELYPCKPDIFAATYEAVELSEEG